jgi:hypothetical protein
MNKDPRAGKIASVTSSLRQRSIFRNSRSNRKLFKIYMMRKVGFQDHRQFQNI